MKNWIQKNLKSIIVTAFVIPILLVAFVSISHVTSFYGISNPFAWAVYLSVAVEIAALSALAGVSVKLGKFIYFPFLLVTFIQFVGNLFFSFSFIEEQSELFKQWMEMAGPLFEPMGIETTDIPTHKLILALFSGGLLPIISLTFAHMLVVYSNREEQLTTPTPVIDLEEVSRQAGLIEKQNQEEETINITQEKIVLLEKHLNELQNQKFGNSEQPLSEPELIEKPQQVEEIIEEPTENKIEEVIEEPQEEIVVENQTVEELKDKLAEDSGIKRLTYTKRNA
jgi:hypothetical protein